MTEFKSARAGLGILFLCVVSGCADDGSGGSTVGDATPVEMDAGPRDSGTVDLAVGADAAEGMGYQVGVTYIEVQGPLDRTLPTAIWYPAPSDITGTPELYAGFIGREAVRDVPVAQGGPWPLIVFSHGNGGVKEQSVFLMEAFAKAGYIVVAPDHVGNTFFNDEPALEPIMNYLRPLDIRATLDRIHNPTEADPSWLRDRLDLDKIGVAGHSRGGYTALAMVGADLGPRADYVAFCAQEPTHEICLRFDPAAVQHDLGDARVTAALPMSPAAYTLTAAGLASVEAPVFILTGLLDELTAYADEVRPLYDALSPPKSLWTLAHGDHFTFSDLCTVYDLLPEESQAMFGQACSDENPLPLDDAHGLIRTVAVAFFDHELKDRPDDAGVLAPTAGDEVTLIRE